MRAFVPDGRTAVVMTLNLTDRYYASTRDVAVVDHGAADAAAIEATFGADWSGAPSAAPGEDLLWSPCSEQPLLALIASARTTLLIENEEMSDTWITSALEACGSGVGCASKW